MILSEEPKAVARRHAANSCAMSLLTTDSHHMVSAEMSSRVKAPPPGARLDGNPLQVGVGILRTVDMSTHWHTPVLSSAGAIAECKPHRGSPYQGEGR